jgi:hypothetical protein
MQEFLEALNDPDFLFFIDDLSASYDLKASMMSFAMWMNYPRIKENPR